MSSFLSAIPKYVFWELDARRRAYRAQGRALIDLGIGLWLTDPAAKGYGAQLRARGKKGGVIGCAMAHRANKIAYALVRDQTGYDPARWA